MGDDGISRAQSLQPFYLFVVSLTIFTPTDALYLSRSSYSYSRFIMLFVLILVVCRHTNTQIYVVDTI